MLQSPHDVCEWGEYRPWRAETGVTHSTLSCFCQCQDNNLVVTPHVSVNRASLQHGLEELTCTDLMPHVSALCFALVYSNFKWRRAQPEKPKRTFLAPPPGHELQSVQVWGVLPSHSCRDLFWSKAAVSTCFKSMYIAIHTKHLYFRSWS